MNYKIVYIPKKTKGKFRKIAILEPRLKKNNESWLSYLNKIQRQLCNTKIVHGFIRGASPVTNADAHIGYRYTLSFDLADFFDTVRPEMVNHLKDERGEIIFDQQLINDTFFWDEKDNCYHAFQGIPTSPIVANLAAIGLDNKIDNICKGKIVYTRYADDLSFSFDDYKYYEKLKQDIPKIVESEGFTINHSKTRLQDGRFRNRIITGISVGFFGIKPTRKTKRKLRAAKHNPKYKHSAVGLEEWCKLKSPKNTAMKEFLIDKDDLQNISYYQYNDVKEDKKFMHGAEGFRIDKATQTK